MPLPDYYTPPSGTGSVYPRSGVLVGFAAELLRLKSVFADGENVVGAKTAQRYFNGAESVSEEARDAVLSTLFAELFPENVAPELAVVGQSGREVLHHTLRSLISEYDVTATELSGPSFRLTDPDFAFVPYARLATLDLGLRWGAYQWRRTRAGARPCDLPSWLEQHALRTTMDRYRESTGLTLTVLAQECEVSGKTMDAWRSGEALPTREGNLEILADTLADYSKQNRSEILFELRLAVFGQAVRNLLSTRLGPRALAPQLTLDLLGTFSVTARLTRELLEEATSQRADTPESRRFVDVRASAFVVLGARYVGAPAICKALAERATHAWNTEVAHDLLSLPGSWFGRLAYWARTVASWRFEREKIRECIGALPVAFDTDEVLGLLPLHLLRMNGYDRPVDLEGKQVIRIKNPPLIAGFNRAAQAAQAHSAGDVVTALEHIDAAIRHQPKNAHFHFTRASYLGELIACGQLHWLQEALQECEISYALDPAQGQPINEIAIITSNARLYEEAETAFARAAPLCDWWAHHHFGRGNNFLPLKRFPEARQSFERCLELDPEHRWAKKRLAAVLWELGEKRAAKSWAAKARADDRVDPLDNVPRWLTLH